jgi:hypothetical protein
MTILIDICSEFVCVLSCAITLCLLTHYITEINLSLSLRESSHVQYVSIMLSLILKDLGINPIPCTRAAP